MKGFKNINEFTLAESQEFLQRNNKDSALCEQVKARLESLLREQEKFDDAMFSFCRTLENFQEYISNYPNGRHIQESIQIIERFIWQKHSKNVELCQSYISNYPNGAFIEEARKKLSEYQKEENSSKKRWFFFALVLTTILCACFFYRRGNIICPTEKDHVSIKEEFSSNDKESIEYDSCAIEVSDSVVW